MSTVNQQLADEALTWGWMLWVGLASWPDELTEISLYARAHDAETAQALRDLARGGQPEEASKLLISRILARLDAGDNPHDLIELSGLTLLESVSEVERPYILLPEDLSDAIHALEHHRESTDPEDGWLRRDAATDTLWLRQEAHRVFSGLVERKYETRSPTPDAPASGLST